MVSFQVLATFVKNAFYLPDIFQLHKYLKLFLLMYRIYVNGNKAIENSGYINIWFTKSGPRKVLLRNYQYFYFSNINMSFTNFFLRKCQFFTRFSNFFWSLCHKYLVPGIQKSPLCMLTTSKFKIYAIHNFFLTPAKRQKGEFQNGYFK